MKQDEEQTIRIPADLYDDCLELQGHMSRFHKGYDTPSIDLFVSHMIMGNIKELAEQYRIASYIADTGELPAHMKLPRTFTNPNKLNK